MDIEKPSQTKINKINISLDLRLVVMLLLAIIAVMFVLWKPWQGTGGSSDRTISVTGEAEIKAEPDEFVFYPTYEFKNADKAAALAELTKKSSEVVKKLKEIGVTDSKIKTDSSGHNYDFYFDPNSGENRYSLRLSVIVDNKELAQKVQDYLVTTSPTGSVSPQANFSDKKRKELERKARDEATKDARTKADQSASNLGFRVGKVKSVDDDAGFGGIMPIHGRSSTEPAIAEDMKQSLTVQPGENDLRYSVTVVYFVR